MNGEGLEKELDEWLDRAAADRGSAKPRPGFEARVLASLHSRIQTRRRNFQWIALGTATAAILVVSFSVFLTRFHGADTLKEATVKPSVLQNPSPANASIRLNTAWEPKPALRAERLGRAARRVRQRHIFSSGLTDRELSLIAFARVVPEDTELRPFEIMEMEIPKLQIPEPEIRSIEINSLQFQTAFIDEGQL
jgi:hypothetical protein